MATSSPALDYLFGLELHGIKLGLENIRTLMRDAGDPQNTYPSVHIGGTNGKGSVAAFLGAMVRAAGYRVGRFTSPHLVDVRERFVVDGEPITPEALDENILFFQTIAERMAQPPTFFELNTAVAFRWFAQCGVDIALVEVGMGGRFDSTNVITPEACAITNISLEHTAYLGETVGEIAFEKAGIIKTGRPVVSAETAPEAWAVLQRVAAERQAPLFRIGDDGHYSLTGPPFRQTIAWQGRQWSLEAPLALAGRHQGQNAAVALALAEVLRGRFDRLTAETARQGLGAARWPCRLERVLDDPPVIVDVAHNAAGADTLAEAIDDCVLVLAVSSDKDVARMITRLAPNAHPLILTQFDGRRARSVQDLSQLARDWPHQCFDRLEEAIQAGMALATPQRPLVITGSIFAAGQARRYLTDAFGAPPVCS